MKLSALMLASAAVLLLSAPAIAGDGDILVRVRATAVVPQMSDNIPGLTVGGDSNFVPEVDGTYFLTDNIAVELIAATTKHTIRAVGGNQLSTVWLLPPTVTAQYHFNPDGDFRPYVGAGVNYTFFYNASDSGALPGHLSYSDNFGWALQAGADVPIGTQGLFLNLDVKKIFLSTGVKLAGVKLGSASIDPWVIGVGVGIKL